MSDKNIENVTLHTVGLETGRTSSSHENVANPPRHGLDPAIQQKVDAALDTAVKENECTELVTWTSLRVAKDLVECSSDFENFSPVRLRPYVCDWQRRNGGDCVEVKWATGHNEFTTLYIPKAALAKTEAARIEALEQELVEERKLSRQLSITLQSMHGILLAIGKLRRFSANDGNPVGAVMAGQLCMQDASELDAAILAASRVTAQLEQEQSEHEPHRKS